MRQRPLNSMIFNEAMRVVVIASMALTQGIAKTLKRLEHFVFQQLPTHYMLGIAGHSRYLVGVAAHLLKDHRAVMIR